MKGFGGLREKLPADLQKKSDEAKEWEKKCQAYADDLNAVNQKHKMSLQAVIQHIPGQNPNTIVGMMASFTMVPIKDEPPKEEPVAEPKKD